MLSAIIVAAGSSTRVGFDKLLVTIAGRPVIRWSLQAFEDADCVSQIVIVCRENSIEPVRAMIESAQLTRINAIIPGGERRQDSVLAGLSHLAAETEYIAVHDAARPLITAEEIGRVFSAAAEYGAAALAARVTDTLKLANERQVIVDSVDRTNIFAMQTPQMFRGQLLLDAYRHVSDAGLHVTDEVSAVQNLGAEVRLVPAEQENLKITYADDLLVAECILKHRIS